MQFDKILGIVFAILAFGFIIFIHELGHFIVAKRSGVEVKEFALGMGPTIFKFKRNETIYALRLLPVGGFVAMKNEYDVSGELEENDEGSFPSASIPRRAMIMSAGIIMNFIFGLILVIGVTFYQGSQPGVMFASTTINNFNEAAVSSQWLEEGDTILEVNGKKVNNARDLSYRMSRDKDGIMDFTVLRNDVEVLLEDVTFLETKIAEDLFTYTVDFNTVGIEPVFSEKMYQSLVATKSLVREVWTSLLDLVTGQVSAKYMSGPIGITKVISDFTSTGNWSQTFSLLALLSINFAVLNLVPLPILDGGQLLYLIIEAIKGSPVKENVRLVINGVCVVALIALMIFATFNDISNLISRIILF